MPISKKVCLLGDKQVGKTSLVRRLVYQRFDERYLSTLGVHVARSSLSLPTASAAELILILWDAAGEDDIEQMQGGFLRGAAGAVLVCDLTRPSTLAAIGPYASRLRSFSPGAQLIIAANKRDAPGQQLARAQIEEFAGLLHAPFYLTSAKTGGDVHALFHHLGRLMLF